MNHISTPKVFRLTGRMDSFYPGYCGQFAASIIAPSPAKAKSLFKRLIKREYYTDGLEAALVAPILRFDVVQEVADGFVWGIVRK